MHTLPASSCLPQLLALLCVISPVPLLSTSPLHPHFASNRHLRLSGAKTELQFLAPCSSHPFPIPVYGFSFSLQWLWPKALESSFSPVFHLPPPPSVLSFISLSLSCNSLLGKPAVFHLQNISFIRTLLTAPTTNSSAGHQHLPCKSPPPSGPWTSTIAPTTIYSQHCSQSILSAGKLDLSENPEMKPRLT